MNDSEAPNRWTSPAMVRYSHPETPIGSTHGLTTLITITGNARLLTTSMYYLLFLTPIIPYRTPSLTPDIIFSLFHFLSSSASPSRPHSYPPLFTSHTPPIANIKKQIFLRYPSTPLCKSQKKDHRPNTPNHCSFPILTRTRENCRPFRRQSSGWGYNDRLKGNQRQQKQDRETRKRGQREWRERPRQPYGMPAHIGGVRPR